LSEILPSNGLRPGPGEVGQGGLILFHLWRYSQKNYFRWNSSLLLWHLSYVRTKPRAICLLWRKNPENWPDAKVLG